MLTTVSLSFPKKYFETEPDLGIFSLMDTSKILGQSFTSFAQNYQNKTLVDDYPRPFSTNYFPCQLPTTETGNCKYSLSQPPVQLVLAM